MASMELERGWQLVSKRRINAHRCNRVEASSGLKARPPNYLKLPPALHHRCLRCLARDHRRSECRDPIRCWACGRLHHTARRCPSFSMSAHHHRYDSRSLTVEGPASGGSRRPPSTDRYDRRSEERAGIDHKRRPRQAWVGMEASIQTQQRQELLTSRAVLVADKGRSRFVDTNQLRDYVGAALGSSRFSVHLDYPADFLIVCDSSHMRDDLLAVKEIAIGDKRVQFFPWSAERFGRSTHWDFSVRISLEGMPHQAWNVESVKRLLGYWCVVQHIDTASLNHTDLRCLRLWAWTKDPYQIPTMCYFTLTTPSFPGQPEIQNVYTRPNEWKKGLEYCVNIHLEKIVDLSLNHPPPVVQVGPKDENKVRIREHRWYRGYEDGDEDLARIHQPERRERSRTPRRFPVSDKAEGNEGWSKQTYSKSCKEDAPPQWRKWDDDEDDIDRNRDYSSKNRYQGRQYYSAPSNKGKETATRGRSPTRHGYRYRNKDTTVVENQVDWLDRGERRALELLWAEKGAPNQQNAEAPLKAQPATETQPMSTIEANKKNTEQAGSASSGNNEMAAELLMLTNESQKKLQETLSSVIQGATQRALAVLLDEGIKKLTAKNAEATQAAGTVIEGTQENSKGQEQGMADNTQGASASEAPVISIPNTAELHTEEMMPRLEYMPNVQNNDEQCTPTSKTKASNTGGEMAKEQIARKWNLDHQSKEDVIAKELKTPLTEAHIEAAEQLISEHLPKKTRRSTKVN